jgi:hypothetical protein
MALMRRDFRILHLLAFSIAMGYLESAVVVYLREIYYPEGFAFPLKMMSEKVMITEVFREFSTLVMLAGIGIMAGRKACTPGISSSCCPPPGLVRCWHPASMH